VWIGLIWLRIGTGGGNEPSYFIKGGKFFWIESNTGGRKQSEARKDKEKEETG
jgi:hypothetical protein